MNTLKYIFYGLTALVGAWFLSVIGNIFIEILLPTVFVVVGEIYLQYILFFIFFIFLLFIFYGSKQKKNMEK